MTLQMTGKFLKSIRFIRVIVDIINIIEGERVSICFPLRRDMTGRSYLFDLN